MKKRTLIVATMTVAMAAFVGCSKDFDFVAAPEQGNAGLDQRPEVGSPALTFGVDTRATVTDAEGDNISWKYEVNDQVGAMLVDRTITDEEVVTLYTKSDGTGTAAEWTYADYFAGSKVYTNDNNKSYAFSNVYKKVYDEVALKDVYVKPTGEEFYRITNDEVWTNYPYKTEDAKNFKTPATLVEGHYMFYAPYSERNGKRGPLSAYLPGVQEVGETGTDAVAAFYGNEDGNPVWLGMSYLSAAETSSVSPEIGHIFAYPKFTIVNNFNGYLFDGDVQATGKELGGTSNSKYFISTDEAATYTMTVKEIEFYTNNEDGFAYERVIEPKALAEVKDWAGGAEYKTTYTDKVAVPVAGSASFDNKGKVKFDNGLAAEVSKKQQRIAVTVNKELPFGEKFSFYVVMPAADYTEDGLFARVLVTIGDKDYYIITNDVADNAYNKDGVVKGLQLSKAEEAKYFGHAYVSQSTGFAEVKDYQIIDRGNHGSKNIELVRGQRWPAAEVNDDKTLKNFKGELLTIDLVGGMGQVAVAAATEKTVVDNGIKNTQDLIDFLGNAHRAAAVKEVASADKVENENTDFYFVQEDNTTTITAELVAELKNRLPEGSFTLTTNLPIEADVMVNGSGNKYTFTAGDYSYLISYTETANAFKNGKVGAGINRVQVEAATELEMADGADNAVVFVDSDDVTLKNPAGINGIVVADAKILTVNATADVAAWIVAGNDAIIDIKAGSKGLTNPNNDFTEATVNNQALATVDGEVNVVTYEKTGYITDVIPAATQVNYVTINAAAETELPVEQTNFAFAAQLKDVTIKFGVNVTSLRSNDDITLGDNVVALVTANNSLNWYTDNKVSGITVELAKGVEHKNIAGVDGVKITNRQ